MMWCGLTPTPTLIQIRQLMVIFFSLFYVIFIWTWTWTFLFLFQDDEQVVEKPMKKSMLLKLRSKSLKLEKDPIPFTKRMEKRCQDYRE